MRLFVPNRSHSDVTRRCSKRSRNHGPNSSTCPAHVRFHVRRGTLLPLTAQSHTVWAAFLAFLLFASSVIVHGSTRTPSWHPARRRQVLLPPLMLCALALAGASAAAEDAPYDRLEARVRRLEQELRETRQELQRARKGDSIGPSPDADGTASPSPLHRAGSEHGANVPQTILPAAERREEEVILNGPATLRLPSQEAPAGRLDEQGSMLLPRLEELTWRKGDFFIVPYGIGWLNVAYDTSRTVTGPFTLYVLSHDLGGEDSFNVNARATRFGLDIRGPTSLGADSAGRIEFDFHGQAEFENRTGVLLRQAYGEFKTDQWRVVGGQTDDVISPLSPNVLNYTVGWAAGNIGYRRAQVRVERYVPLGGDSKLTLQSSINRTIVVDFVGAPNLQGEDAGWPTVMGRMAVEMANPGDGANPVEIGISGHIGEEAADFNVLPVQRNRRFLSWSLNTDVHVPISDRFGFQGEFFVGQVLGTFLGGINQGIDPVEREGIRSIGGWVEFWCYLTEQLHSHVGYGIDDPNNDDLSAGRRSLNQFYFGNLIYDVTELFSVGVEASWWETRYVDLTPGEALRLEAVMKYRF
jgi:hypothetical protein